MFSAEVIVLLAKPNSWPDFEDEYLDLGERIEALLDKQNEGIDYGMVNLSLGQTSRNLSLQLPTVM